MTVLADTSVWVEFLRHGQAGNAARLDDLLTRHQVVICGPVVAELLAGTAAPQRAQLARQLGALPWVDLHHPQWIRVGEVAAKLRDQGTTTALTDVEIAVAAVEAGAELWTRDSDFQRVAKVLAPLSFFVP